MTINHNIYILMPADRVIRYNDMQTRRNRNKNELNRVPISNEFRFTNQSKLCEQERQTEKETGCV